MWCVGDEGDDRCGQLHGSNHGYALTCNHGYMLVPHKPCLSSASEAQTNPASQ